MLFIEQMDRRSPYVTLPWQQNFRVSTNRGPANMSEKKRKNLTSMTFLCMIKLRNKTVANSILPSFVNGNGCLCQERLWRQKFCYHGNVTSYFDSHFPFHLFSNRLHYTIRVAWQPLAFFVFLLDWSNVSLSQLLALGFIPHRKGICITWDILTVDGCFRCHLERKKISI